MTSRNGKKAVQKATGGKFAELAAIPRRHACGKIRKEDATPLQAWTRPPEETLAKREAILGSRTATGELEDPLTHLQARLSPPQIDAAHRFRRHGKAFLASLGAIKPYTCTLGTEQARGSISAIGWDDLDQAWPERSAYEAALNVITNPSVSSVTCNACVFDGFRFGGGSLAAYEAWILAPMLPRLRLGLDCLVKHYGFDKVAASGTWAAE